MAISTQIWLRKCQCLILKTSDSNFEFSFENGNFKNVVRNYVDNLSTKPSQEYKSQNRSAKSSSQQIDKIWWSDLTSDMLRPDCQIMLKFLFLYSDRTINNVITPEFNTQYIHFLFSYIMLSLFTLNIAWLLDHITCKL